MPSPARASARDPDPHRPLLRPKSPADPNAVYAIISEWEVVRWTASWPWPPERAFTEGRMAGAQPAEGMIACLEREGAVIGMASVIDGELGYMLAPGAWGRGYATKACGALVGHGFRTTDWPEVRAGVFKGNDASLRVVGEERSPCRALGREVEVVGLALGRSDCAGA